MARNFRELEAKMPPEARERAAEKARALIAAMPLQQIRSARQMTQTRLAELLEMDQGNISKLEKRTDIPARVIVSEYVDVAHAFVDKTETGMVNAVLDKLARSTRAREFG